MSEAEPVSGTVFISDDDDDLDAPEDEWLNDGFTVSGAEQHPYLIHAAHIQHQLTLCYGLLCALPVLALVILSWRKYGAIIGAAQRKDGDCTVADDDSSRGNKKED